MDRTISYRRTFGLSGICGLVLAAALGVAGLIGVAPVQAQEMCGGVTYPFPYTDVSGVSGPFCPGIMEAYVTGISKGTTPTTFSPNNDVPRLQMTTFLQRTVDQVLTRGSRRAALNQWWIPLNNGTMQSIPTGGAAIACAADGEAIWTTNHAQVLRVQASTGAIVGTWTGATNSYGVVAASGKIYVTGEVSPGNLYVIDPVMGPGPVVLAASNLGDFPLSVAFDGESLWTANNGFGGTGSVSMISPQSTTPYPVNTFTAGFTDPIGILFDGAHIWVTDGGAGTLLKLGAGGVILQTVTVGTAPGFPVFDGTNIWVPNQTSNSITVVQASTGNVVATINSDGINFLNGPVAASFDGERVLVTNSSGGSVTLFKAADLSFIAVLLTGVTSQPLGACSDGINFWVDTKGLSRI